MSTSAASRSWPAISIIASMRTRRMEPEPADRPVATENSVSVSQTRQISSLGY